MKKTLLLIAILSSVCFGVEKPKAGQVWLQPRFDPFSPGVQLTIITDIRENSDGEDWVQYKFRYSDSDYVGTYTARATTFTYHATLIGMANKNDSLFFKIPVNKKKLRR